MKNFKIILMLTFISFTGCANSDAIISKLGISNSTNSGTVGIKRKQLLIYPAKKMKQGAVEAYSKILQDEKIKGNLNVNKTNLNRIRIIAKNIIPHTSVFRKDAPNWNWEVNLIKSDQLNAWCMPGGKIAFYSAIIEKLNLTDSEIAAIMGHEIAHALREHSRERASRGVLSDAVVKFGSASLGIGDLGTQLANQTVHYAITLPNSRGHENEADIIGIELSARAGYDPRGAVSVWEKMEKVSKSSKFDFLSTHPSNNNRIRELTKYSKKVMHLYKN